MRCGEDQACLEGEVRRSRQAISAAGLGPPFYAPSTRRLEGAQATACRQERPWNWPNHAAATGSPRRDEVMTKGKPVGSAR